MPDWTPTRKWADSPKFALFRCLHKDMIRTLRGGYLVPYNRDEFSMYEEADKMALSARAKELVAEITRGNLKLGDLKKRGTEIKKDHDLAMELWSTGEYIP